MVRTLNCWRSKCKVPSVGEGKKRGGTKTSSQFCWRLPAKIQSTYKVLGRLGLGGGYWGGNSWEPAGTGGNGQEPRGRSKGDGGLGTGIGSGGGLKARAWSGEVSGRARAGQPPRSPIFAPPLVARIGMPQKLGRSLGHWWERKVEGSHPKSSGCRLTENPSCTLEYEFELSCTTDNINHDTMYGSSVVCVNVFLILNKNKYKNLTQAKTLVSDSFTSGLKKRTT